MWPQSSHHSSRWGHLPSTWETLIFVVLETMFSVFSPSVRCGHLQPPRLRGQVAESAVYITPWSQYVTVQSLRRTNSFMNTQFFKYYPICQTWNCAHVIINGIIISTLVCPMYVPSPMTHLGGAKHTQTAKVPSGTCPGCSRGSYTRIHRLRELGTLDCGQ